MSRKYRIRHETSYKYAADVVHSHHLLHLVPRPAPYQECLEHQIEIVPDAHRRVSELDAFGNPMIRVELATPHRELNVVSRMEIEVHHRPLVPVSTTDIWEKVRDYSAGCFGAGEPLLACAEKLSTKLHKDIKYAPGETTISTAVTEVLEKKLGVCQDFAHLMISCLRSRGLPARYVSGYLRTNSPGPAEGANQDKKLVGDAASHAWVSVWSPPYGWVEFDPTNGCFAGLDHIAVAWGRDFGDVSPLRGVILGGADHRLAVTVLVEPMAN